MSRVLHSVVVSSVHERQWQSKLSTAKGHEDKREIGSISWKDRQGAGPLQPAGEGSGEILPMFKNTWWGGIKTEPVPSWLCPGIDQNMMGTNWNSGSSFKMEHHHHIFYSKGVKYSNTLTGEVVESLCVDTQSLNGHSPEQPAQTNPNFAGRVGLDSLRLSLSTSSILLILGLL